MNNEELRSDFIFHLGEKHKYYLTYNIKVHLRQAKSENYKTKEKYYFIFFERFSKENQWRKI